MDEPSVTPASTPLPEAATAPIYDISGDKPVLGQVPHEQVQDALLSGKYSLPKGQDVHVISPDGKLGTVPSEQAKDALNSGYQYATPDMVSQSQKEEKYGTPLEMAKTAGEGALQGALGPVGTGIARVLGADPEAMRARADVNPWTHGLAEGAGFIAPAVLTGGASAAAEGLEGASLASKIASNATLPGIVSKVGEGAQALTGLGGEGASVLSKVGASAAKLGAENALMQTGDEVSKYFENDPAQTTQSAIANIGLSGVLGAAIGAPLGVVSPAWNALKGSGLGQYLSSIQDNAQNGGMNGFVKKALSSLGGVSEENIDKYVANRDAINSTPEFRDIYDQYLPKVEQIHDDLLNKRISAQDAQANLNAASRVYKDQLVNAGYDLSKANQAAKTAMAGALDDTEAKLKTNAINQAPNVVDAVQQLHKSVIDQSENSWDIANKSGKVIDLKPFYDKAESSVQDLNESGTIEGRQMAERLSSYIDGVKKQFGEKSVVADKAKGLIQGLDKVSNYDFNATSFDKGISRYYKGLRYTLDSSLKDAVPEYAEAMKPLAKDTKLLSNLSKYGDEQSAARRISALKGEVNYKYEMPMLKQLEEKTGGSFTGALEAHANDSVKQGILDSLPEVKKASEAAAALEHFKNPETQQALKRQIESLPEYAEHERAQKELGEALAAKDGLHGLTPTNLETKLNAAIRGKLNVEKAIDALPQMNGKNLSEVLDNLKVKQAFEGGHTNGSKNVNLYGGLLGGLGGALGGHVMGGLAGGAALGSFMDKYGHTVVKKILDGYLDRGGLLPKMIGESNPSAVRVALTKLLSSDKEVNGNSFKVLSHLISSSYEANAALVKNSQKIFNGDPMNIKHPSDDDISKLDKRMKDLSGNPTKMFNMSDDLSHYAPGHAQALSQTANAAMTYLQSQRPQAKQLSPLDSKIEPTKAEKMNYDRTLQIVENPLVALHHVKNATLLPQDVVAIKSVYPAYYNKMSQELTNSMMDHTAKGETVPYRIRQSCSLFLGHPLDSTMTPSSIQSVQSIYAGKQSGPPNAPVTKNKRNTSNLGKLADGMQTASQASEAKHTVMD